MANEATIRSSLQIRADNIEYNSQPTQFRATVTGRKGPTPGAVTCTTAGTNIDLSQLTTPGFCRIQNLDETNYVEYGIWDPEGSLFFPWGEAQPGESFVFRFSRNFAEDYAGTGTGTSAATNRLMIKAHTASCVVLVEAFEA